MKGDVTGAAPREVRVVIADDHPIVRSGLRWALLETPGYAVLGEAGDGIEALQLVLEVAPDVLLVDLTMPHLDGFGVLELLRKWSSAARTIVLTEMDGDITLRQALLLGAAGILPKSATAAEVIEAVRRVHAGERCLRRGERLQAGAEKKRNGASGRLTPREREVACLIAQGRSKDEIAAALGIHKHTVSNQVCAILRKLKADDSLSLSLAALAEGVGTAGEENREETPAGLDAARWLIAQRIVSLAERDRSVV